MSALDRALIKAYRRQRGGAASYEPEPCGSEVTTLAYHPAEEVLSGPHRRTTESDAEPQSPVDTVVSIADWITFRVDVGVAGVPAAPNIVPVERQLEPPRSIVYGDAAIAPKSATAIERPLMPEALEPRAEPSAQPTNPPLSSVLPEQPTAAAESEKVLPQLVVDRFQWPEICDELRPAVIAGWRQFSESFGGGPGESRAVALLSADPGTGCSTTLLCIARQLSAEGAKVAIVDANFAHPGLAQQLSIKASAGWDAAFDGRVLLGEVLIESLADRMVLAPLVEGTLPASVVANHLQAARGWKMLRAPHDVLLVDAGTIDGEESLASLKALCEAAALDGVFVVCDRRTTTPHEIVGLGRALQQAGVNLLGTIENFSDRQVC